MRRTDKLGLLLCYYSLILATLIYPRSTGMAKGTRAQDVTSRVMEYFQSHPRKVVNIQEIVKATKLERHQIQNSITRLNTVLGFPIETLTRGQIWRWVPEEEAVNLTIVPDPEPEPQPVPEVKEDETDHILVQFLGMTPVGDAIVRDISDNMIYRMQRL